MSNESELIEQIMARFDRLYARVEPGKISPSQMRRADVGFADLLKLIDREILQQLVSMRHDEAFMVSLGILFEKIESELKAFRPTPGHA